MNRLEIFKFKVWKHILSATAESVYRVRQLAFIFGRAQENSALFFKLFGNKIVSSIVPIFQLMFKKYPFGRHDTMLIRTVLILHQACYNELELRGFSACGSFEGGKYVNSA